MSVLVAVSAFVCLYSSVPVPVSVIECYVRMYKPYEKPINSNYLHAFSSAGGGGAAREIRRNEEMSTRAETFHTNQQK